MTGVVVHCIGPTAFIWGMSRRTVLRWSGAEWRPYAQLPGRMVDCLDRSRALSRLLRLGRSALFETRSGALLAVRAGTAYRVDPDGVTPLFRIRGRAPLHGGLAEAGGSVYFGEYHTNAGREPTTIWRVRSDLGSWEPALRLDDVRHVHQICGDPYDGALWATTGDRDGECFLMRSTDGFRTVERFGDGSQGFRAVRLFFTGDHVSWITDSETSQNHAARLHRRTRTVDRGQCFPSPAWYGTTTTDGLHVAMTSVERRVRTQQARIWVSRDAWTWTVAHSLRKDAYPFLFQSGNFLCPSGALSSDRLWVSGLALRGLDGSSVRLKLTPG